MAKSEAVEVGTIGKADLVRLAQQKTETKLNFDIMNDAYSGVCDAIVECLMNGNTVILQGVGRLIPIVRPGGEGRNPSTGDTITYEDRLALKFQVNTNLKLAMRSVDIKSLGTGGTGKRADKAGQAETSGRGGSTAGRGKAVASESRRPASGKQTTSARTSRRG